MNCILEKESRSWQRPLHVALPYLPPLLPIHLYPHITILTESTLFLEIDGFMVGITVVIPLTCVTSIIWMLTSFSAPLSKIWYLRAIPTTRS